jgi:hypothetical protein
MLDMAQRSYARDEKGEFMENLTWLRQIPLQWVVLMFSKLLSLKLLDGWKHIN